MLNQKFRSQSAGLRLGELRHVLGGDIHFQVYLIAGFPAAQIGIPARILDYGYPERAIILVHYGQADAVNGDKSLGHGVAHDFGRGFKSDEEGVSFPFQ